MDVLGELIVRPTLASHEIDGERQVIVEEIRSYLDDPSEYCQILFQQAMFGDGPLGREICGDEAGIRTLPEDTIRQFWADRYRPSNVVVAVAGDLAHDEAVALVDRAFGSGNGTFPTFAPAPTLPAGKRYLLGHRDTTQAHLAVGVPSLPARPSRLLDARRAQHGPRRRDEQPPLPVGPRGEGPGLRRRLGHRRLRRRRRPRHLRRRRSRSTCSRALEAILVELARLRDELVPDEELAKAKAYLSGGLELRMDETRHLASWIGGQEALHDRVMTLDEALAAVAEVTVRGHPARRVRAHPRRGPAPRGRRPAEGRASTLDRSLRLPA